MVEGDLDKPAATGLTTKSQVPRRRRRAGRRRRTRGCSMGLPVITSFCWCMDLRAGTTFIAYMHLVISVSLVSLTAWFAASLRGVAGTLEDEDGVYARWLAIAAAASAASCAHVVLAAVLLCGVYGSRVGCVRAWAACMCVLCACAALYAAGAACAGVAGSGAEIFLPLLEAVLFFGMLSYSILCVNSYYLYLRSVKDEEFARV